MDGFLEQAPLGLAGAAAAETVQERYLDVIDRVDEGVSDLDRSLEPGIAREERPASGDGAQHPDRRSVLILDDARVAAAKARIGHEHGIPPGDFRVGLGERHLEVVDQVAEKRPAAIHLPEKGAVFASRPAEGLQRAPDRIPGVEKAPVLRPGEDPGDRAKVLDPAGSSRTAGRAGADLEVLDLVQGRRSFEEGDEIRSFDERPVAGERDLRDLGKSLLEAREAARFHRLVPARNGSGQDARREEFQVVEGRPAVGVLGRDHLPLLRDLDPPADRSRGLGQNGRVRRPAAAAHGPAPAVEEAERDAVPPSDFGEGLLRPVEGPSGSQDSPVLAGVRVSQHHLLNSSPRLDVPPVGPISQETVDHAGGAREIVDRLEERDDVEGGEGLPPFVDLREAGFFCEKNDGENVALVVRHADDVGPDRHRRDVLQDPADGPERRHALPRLGGEARAGGNERPGR